MYNVRAVGARVKMGRRNAGRGKGGSGPSGRRWGDGEEMEVDDSGRRVRRYVMSLARESERARTEGSYVGARTEFAACSFSPSSSAL